MLHVYKLYRFRFSRFSLHASCIKVLAVKCLGVRLRLHAFRFEVSKC